MEPTPNYTHQRWRLEEEEEEEGARVLDAVSNATLLPVAEKREPEESRGDVYFRPPPLNDKRKCYPDMMGISKMAVQRSESMQRQIALPYAGLVKTSIVTSVRG